MLRLCQITYTNATNMMFTAFIAMTDEEFEAFRSEAEPEISPYRDRSVHVVEGRPSPADIEAAQFAFAHAYGNAAVARS